MSETGNPSTAQGLIRRLEDAVTALNRIPSGQLTADAAASQPGDAWSPLDILVHLRASDDILIPRVYQVLVRDNPPLPAFDERRWAEIAGYADAPADAHFARLVIRWYELIQLLRGLPDDAWHRTGDHETNGPITLEQIVNHLVGHAEEHIAQLDGLLNRPE